MGYDEQKRKNTARTKDSLVVFKFLFHIFLQPVKILYVQIDL